MFKNAKERLNSKELCQKVQIKESIKVYKKLKFNSKILSVSCGDGIWDFLLVNKFDHLIKKLICTDIVKNPIELSIYNSMKKS